MPFLSVINFNNFNFKNNKIVTFINIYLKYLKIKKKNRFRNKS